MSNEKFACIYVANLSASAKLIWMNNTRIRLKCKENCLKQEDKAGFTSKNVVNLFIAYKLNTWSRDSDNDFIFKGCFFGLSS